MVAAEIRKELVLTEAVSLASKLGLEGVTIGALAEATGMSKSGLFAHFKSKQALQIALLDEAVSVFVNDVVTPALLKPRGEPRLRALLELWYRWANSDLMPGGCVFVASIAEVDDKPGPVRDRLAAIQLDWIETLATSIRIAVAEGHFRSDVVPEDLAREMVAQAYGHHLLARLLRDPRGEQLLRASFERLLASAKPSAA